MLLVGKAVTDRGQTDRVTILPNANLNLLRTDCTDSPDCIPMLLGISVFLLLVFLFSTL